MIKENEVDLTGLVYNVNFKDYDTYSGIYFNLSMRHKYTDRDGNKVSKYNVVSCALTSNKNTDGNNDNSFNFFKDNIKEGQLLRIQGMISSWMEGLVNGGIVAVTQDNKHGIEKFIPRNIIRVTGYKFLETMKNKEQEPKEGNIGIEEHPIDEFELPSYKTY